MKRRDFLKTTAVAGAGAALLGACTPVRRGDDTLPKPYRVGGRERMRLSWEPYELQLQHTFTVAS